VDGVYKPLRSPALTALLIRVRSRFGSHPIPTRKVSRELLRRRHIPRLLGLVADLCPERDEEKYWTRFLNQDTAFHIGPAKLARSANAPLVFIAMSRLRRGYYEISFEHLAEPPYCETPAAILERYVRRLEAQIHSHPEDWLWIYHRWRYPPPQPSGSLQVGR
jgi:KDO2-lipid IV(A) lauroyltransferase